MAPCAMGLCACISVRVCKCKISLDAEIKSGLRWGGGVKIFLLMVSSTYRKDELVS